MSQVVQYSRTGATGVITIDYPPVNALGFDVRTGLIEGLEAGLADDEAKVLVIVGGGRTFPAGADVREFGKPSRPPVLPEVISRLEASAKPLVAALHGTALGGGLEVALGCHYRVALPSAKVGLPEVKLGLLPGAGGTLRLPRLVGVEKAMDIILSGAPMTAAEALELGILDAVEDVDSALTAGLRMAEKVIAEGLPPRPVSRMDDKVTGVDLAVFEARRAELARKMPHLFAPHRIIDAVEASTTLPFDDGMKRERALFLQCMDSPQRGGLIHAFFSEREVAKVPGLSDDVKPRPVDSVAIIGAGTMGGGIAMCFASAGIPVHLVDMTPEALEKGMGIIRRNYEATAKKGRMTMEAVEACIGRITPTMDYADLAGVDLVIEAVFENMGVKKEIFGRLDEVCKPGAILASNTSTLDINVIASATKRPQDVVGMHFFSPANVMKLLENVRTDSTADDVVATVMALGKRINKVAVLVGVCYGFVGNRMLHRRGAEATALVDAGASPQQVDKVLTDFGFPMGQFAMGDLAGIDVGWRIREERRKNGEPDAPPVNWVDRLAEMGRFGQKTGAGIYKYEAGNRKPIPDPDVDVLVADYRQEKGITPRAITDQEILERTLYVMVNEGAKILEEGIAARALDIDVIWIYGYGFPSFRGGPMYWADQVGLDVILSAIKGFRDTVGGSQWEPAPLLERLVREGKGFSDL